MIFWGSLRKFWPKMKYKLSELVNLMLNIPFLIKCHDIIPYLTNKANRMVMNTFIKDKSCLSVSKEADFQKRYTEIHSRYEKIVFCQFYMRHIGEMCLTYYFWHIENKEKNNLLYVMVPVLLHDSFDKIPNNYFFKKIQEKIELIQEDNYEFWCWMFQHHMKEIEFSTKYSWKEMQIRDMDYIDISDDCFQVFLNFEEQATLERMKVRDKFICIYNRDNAYYQAMGIRNRVITPAEEARNSLLSDYDLLVKEFDAKGISSVRMGYHVEEKANIEEIIDYANKYRTEVLDFYLISKCKFFMVSSSGIMLIAKLFTTPLVVVNSPVLSFGGDMVTPMSPKRDLILMKKIWYPEQKRYLSLDEILYIEGKYKSYRIFDAYHSIGIVFHSNSQEELLDIAEEMRNKLEGNLIYSAEDEKLQERYRSILEKYVKSNGNHYYNGRYGTRFLQQNHWFLEEIDEELSIKNIL